MLAYYMQGPGFDPQHHETNQLINKGVPAAELS
jgi:hypothetical protein